jgi:glycerate kinase
MRVVIAPDSFKECASAAAVSSALSAGWKSVFPEAEVVCVPMADGGEGTVDALIAATGGTEIELQVMGPLGTPVVAKYGFLGERVVAEDRDPTSNATAVIEMAAASGLPLVPPEKRDPRATTTYGTGELVRDALERGAHRIILGIGGSATNDGGAGMAQALGFSLLDDEGRELPPGGAALARLARIDSTRRHARLDGCHILVACDVTSPLCGPQGASLMYGPQKGATEAVARQLDAALDHYGKVLESQLGVCVADLPGAGAAGGLGAGLVAFTGAELRPGVELVAEACGLARQMEGAELVITGEGRLDGQTAHGKTPAGVAIIAKQHGIPVIAVAGALGTGYREIYAQGIDAVFAICQGPMTLPESVGRVEELLAAAAESIARFWRVSRRD